MMSDRAVERLVRNPASSIRQQKKGGGEVRTDKTQGDANDVNNIIKRYMATGDLPTTNAALAQFEDVTALQGDLTERLAWAAQQVENARQMLQDEQERQRQEAQRIEQSVTDQKPEETSEVRPETPTPAEPT